MVNNKKGFTLVELVLSVALLSIVLVFMMAALVELKDKEKTNGADAKMLVNQAIIAKTVNSDIITLGLDSISACASMDCFYLIYKDGSEKTLKLMSDKRTLIYGNDATTDIIRTLPTGRNYSSIHYYIYGNLEVLRISVSKVYKNEDYDVEIYNYMGNKTTDTGNYAASGLLLHYDGINNSGTGVHNAFSSTWMDLSGNGNNGVLKNMSLTSTETSGWIENGLVFDGNDDGVFIGDQLSTIFKFSNTIEVTVSKSVLNNVDLLLGNCSSTNCTDYSLDVNNAMKVSFNGAKFVKSTDTPSVTTDAITTLTFVYNKELGTITTFINGLKGEIFNSTEIINFSELFNQVWLGRNSAAGATAFKGIIYSLRIYSYALSDSKIYSNSTIDKIRFQKQYVYTSLSEPGSQTFTAISSGLYKIELWGARGGNVASYTGGAGAYTAGTIELTQGDSLYLFVGTIGSDSTSVGGYNGGGSLISGQEAFGRAGGGATDVRLLNDVWDNTLSLNSRIMVAAGGAGANYRSSGYGEGNGGAGGGLTGYEGEIKNATNGYGSGKGTGGTQISGGKIIYYAGSGWGNSETASGLFGKGGGNAQSGGGSGYYGGGSSAHGGSGGGSSFISGHLGSVAVTAEFSSTPIEGCETGNVDAKCSTHYSRKVFNDTVMIDGLGYQWTNTIGTRTLMPKPAGGYYATNEGNRTNGYVRITYLGQVK